jgi:putative ABC transport system permease protein
MGLLIRLAWRNLWRHRRRTLITTSAMAIGLVFGMATVSLMDGVYTLMFRMMITDTVGHAQLHDPDYPGTRPIWETIGEADAVVAELEALQQVEQVAPRLYGAALLGAGELASGARLFGVDPRREDAVTGIGAKTAEGSFEAIAGPLNIALGVDLAADLGVGLGDEVVAVGQAADGSTANDLFTVVALLETGSVALDRGGAWLSLGGLQQFMTLPGQVHEVVAVASRRDAIPTMLDACVPTVERHGLLLRSWREVNPQMAQMIDMSDVFTAIFTLMILGAAALGVLNTMLMSVFERTRELGVFRALGMRPDQMVALVLVESAALAVVATAIGVPVGLALVGYLSVVGMDLSSMMSGFSMMGMNFNTVWMGELHPHKMALTVLGLFVITLGAAVWPAVRAARLRPVEAMRQE